MVITDCGNNGSINMTLARIGMFSLKNLGRCLLAMSLTLIAVPALAAWELNMPRGVTPLSKEIFDLHMIILWICVAIGAIVFSVMIYSMIFHRKSKGAVPATFHEHTSLELLWAIVPFIILVVMAIPATKVLMAMEDTSRADITIKVTGYQWKWRYEYLDQGISFFSNLTTPAAEMRNKAKKNKWYLLQVDNPLVVPVDKKIRFLVTSADVIHAWWVPELGIKRDAIPGFVHQAWARIDKPGIYRGQCAELCGVHHGFMPIVVKAVSTEEFDAWVAKQQQAKKERELAAAKSWTKDQLLAEGKKDYARFCAACHKIDGTGMPPVFPSLIGSSIVVGKPVGRHVELILHGVPGTAMQAFAKQLTDTQIAAIVTYERNAWGNHTGDVIQPSDVKAIRANKPKKQ
jgi:cytochrome c oxidase subunit II